MKLLNFTTNSSRDGHDLTESQTTYYFEDVQVKIFDTLTATINGYVDLEFGKEDDSFNHSFGTEESFNFFIDSCNVELHSIYDEESEEIGFSKEITKELKQLIEDDLNTQIIEPC